MAPEVVAFLIKFDHLGEIIGQALGVEPYVVRPQVVIGSPLPYTTELAKKIRVQLSAELPARAYLRALCLALLVEMFKPIMERRTQQSRNSVTDRTLHVLRGERQGKAAGNHGIKYIDANLDGNLTVGRLAELIGVSKDQLSRYFKKSVGESPHSYVIQRRSEAARRLLLDHDNPLSDIAYATGFSSQSHMTTAFKNVFGVTPGAVRRQG